MALGSLLSMGAMASPVGAAAGLLGIGLEAFGAVKSHSAGKEYSAAVAAIGAQENVLYGQDAQENMRQARDQQNINALHQQFMEISNQRSQIENLRKAQMARSVSTAGAAEAGTQLGSGYAGAQASITGEESYNALGLSQGLEIGRGIFAQNTDISNSRVAQFGIESNIQQLQTQLQTARATYESKSSEAQGYSSLGGSLLGASGTLMKLFSPTG